MRKYDYISMDNLNAIDGYAKIGTIGIRPDEKTNHDFYENDYSLILDVMWCGAYGTGKTAKFAISLRTSTTLNIAQLSPSFDVISDVLAYKRVEDGFDIYVRADKTVNNYVNIKCQITENFPRFILTDRTPIADITEVEATTFNTVKNIHMDSTSVVSLSTVEDSAIKFYTQSVFYNDATSSHTFNIPNYESGKFYVFNIYDLKNGSLKCANVALPANGTAIITNIGDSNLTCSHSEGVLTIGGLEHYSMVYIESRRLG